MSALEDLPADEQITILKLRLSRAERALHDAETALEGRMRELDAANKELSQRETALVEKLDIESRKLLAAQATAKMATIYGEKGKPFVTSQGTGTLLGLPEGNDVTLEGLTAAIHPLDRDRMMRIAGAFFKDLPANVEHRFEHRIVRYDTQEIRWLGWTLRRDQGGPGSRFYGTLRDITASRANERAVRALQLRAERRVRELDALSRQLSAEKEKTATALQAKTRFLTEMAHAIRTPLNSLNGGLELLADHGAGQSRDFAVVRDAADQLVALASRLIEQADTGDPSGAPDPATGTLPPAAGEKMSAGLPTGTPSTPPPTLQASGPHAHASKALPTEAAAPRVLLAEDTESNRYVIERMLTALGCETVIVTNGVAAVEAVRNASFDVILMDVMMPIMDGEQATQTIRAMSGPASRTPIIGVTAHSLQAERARLLSVGMTACLSKPVRREELETAIRTAMLGREAVQPLNARFDHELFQRTFFDLPLAYRDRMRDAAKKDIGDYGEEVLKAAKAGDREALSRAAHSLKGVAINVGAIGIVEELSRYREMLDKDASVSSGGLRKEIAASLLAFDDLYGALIGSGQ